MTLKISTAAEIGPIEKVTEVVELPFAQNGKKPVLRVRGLTAEQLTLASGGAPTMGGEGGDPAAGLAVLRAIAEVGIVEPPFCFGEAREAGKVWWGDLVAGNQHAVIRAIYRISGVDTSPDAEAAKRLVAFPDDGGGGADRAGAAAPVSPRAKAAR